MDRLRWAAALLLAVLLPAACATAPQPKVAREIDPAPLLAALAARPAPPPAVTATLDAEILGRGGRLKTPVYLLLAPGRLRLEIPGEMGSTLFLLVADGPRAWFLSPSDPGRPAADIPLPARLDLLYDLWAGRIPAGFDAAPRAVLWDNGEVTLKSTGPGEAEITCLFRGGALSLIGLTARAGRLSLNFPPRGTPTHLAWEQGGAQPGGGATVGESAPLAAPPEGAFSPLPGMTPLAGGEP